MLCVPVESGNIKYSHTVMVSQFCSVASAAFSDCRTVGLQGSSVRGLCQVRLHKHPGPCARLPPGLVDVILVMGHSNNTAAVGWAIWSCCKRFSTTRFCTLFPPSDCSEALVSESEVKDLVWQSLGAMNAQLPNTKYRGSWRVVRSLAQPNRSRI